MRDGDAGTILRLLMVAGVKISAPSLDGVLVGTTLRVVNSDEERSAAIASRRRGKSLLSSMKREYASNPIQLAVSRLLQRS